jgi:hypothetical protein
MLMRGLRTSRLQPGQESTGSSFQNSIDFLQYGHWTSKISSKFQRCKSCPGHFNFIWISLYFVGQIANLFAFKTPPDCEQSGKNMKAT